MLTLLHPSLVPTIKQLPIGLLPLIFTDEEHPALVVKAPKECILTAKVNGNIKIYLVPILIENTNTFGLVTAFFDDNDEPLIIRSPLFLEYFSKDLFKLLKNEQINIHFFDELSRERLMYCADVIIPHETQNKIDEIVLLDFSLSRARTMIDAMEISFCTRTMLDDEQAITILLNESVYGDDLFIQDMNTTRHSYHGSRGFSHTTLVREEPGSYQEEDIIQCLLLVFQPDQIYLSPKRTYDKEEMCDILVITDTNILIIQAKDSPNIERISRQKLSRKRSNVLGALKKATEQVKGSIGYYRRISGRLEFLINGELHSVDTTSLEIKTLIVVKELFNDQYDEYRPIFLDVYKNKDVPCVIFDYPEFHQFCFNLPNENAFFYAYNLAMTNAVENGINPRLRFTLE